MSDQITFTPLAQINKQGRKYWSVKIGKRKVGTIKPVE